ncbi:FimV/HubP family polar landmark protein [Undibacterium sp. RuRC25W]|uniref:FimV/HubP family polar landmark protein n=1 Tax=Undibacterium sp. RuRC25W TaxID=3413047 RepID=UPI003BF001BE
MSNANATGMGRLTVLSSLGQPLKAEIELTSPNREEIDTLMPKLASVEAFRQANIEFNSALSALRFAIEPKGAGYVIKVSSSQAMNEPFVDMLLEISSSNGKLLREYTFLLDPAELRNSQSPQVASPNAVVNKAQSAPNNPVSNSQASNQPASRPASSMPIAVTANQSAEKKETPRLRKTADEVAVKSGDTLGKIAAAYQQEGVSLDQMLVGLYRANPQAFIGKNMNRLKAGQILNVPDAATVKESAGGAVGAHSVVLAHAADFNAYRNHLADYVDRSQPSKTMASKQSAGGSIVTNVKEVPTATTESLDKLKLSKAAPTSNDKAGSAKGGIEEDKLAKKKAVDEAAGRLKELEKNVGDLQRLLDVKNKDLAAKESELSDKNKAKVDAKSVAGGAASVAAEAAAKGVAVVAASLPASTVVATNAAASAPVAAPASSPAVVSSVGESVASNAASASAKPIAKRRTVAPPPPEPSFFDDMSDFLLPGGGVVLALLAGAGVLVNRRKKKLQQFEDSILTGSSMKANSMFGSTGGQSVDTNNSVFNSNFAPSASQLDANEVDPVAEADVYIAYGRDSQAEEILKEALRTQPDRHAVRVKLLEIYFARKDAKLFERLASELYGMTGGQGDEWAQVASMGIVLEPGNPLYAGGKAKTDTFYGASLGSPTQPLEDLDPDALLGNSLSKDMLEAISIIDINSHDEVEGTGVETPIAQQAEPVADTGLDFDLGMDDHIAPQIPQSPVNAPLPEAEVSELDFGSIDFDFGDGKLDAESSNSVDLVPEQHEPHADQLQSMDFDVPNAEFGDFDLDLAAKMPVASDEISLPDGEMDPESQRLLPEAASAFEFDLSGISLDLPSDAPSVAPVAEALEPVVEVNAEMATKLDLAVAYHEIGDKEGARELLDEVLKGGTADQKERAGNMLTQMA